MNFTAMIDTEYAEATSNPVSGAADNDYFTAVIRVFSIRTRVMPDTQSSAVAAHHWLDTASEIRHFVR